jgi:hypothetical protein
MQGFGQHEPLFWLDLHGCSFVSENPFIAPPVRRAMKAKYYTVFPGSVKGMSLHFVLLSLTRSPITLPPCSGFCPFDL